MTRIWEYKVLYSNRDHLHFEIWLNELGSHGWEYVEMYPVRNPEHTDKFHIFKRLKEPAGDGI